MSLVGSLEDLGLGDILQIVSLARKSGRLLLSTGGDNGRIVVCQGMVRGATIKGDIEDLRGLLVTGGQLSPERFDDARELAAERGIELDEAVVQAAGFPRERLDALRREQVERAVMRMFAWRNGEFSFEVCDEPGADDVELLLATGINTQYLAMEATRLRDEGSLLGAPLSEPPDDEDPLFSGEDPDPADRIQPLESAIDAMALATAHGVAAEPYEADDTQPGFEPRAPVEVDEAPAAPPVEVSVAVAAEASEEVPPEASIHAAPEARVEDGDAEPDPPPLVVVDRNLTGLEWLKLCAGEAFPRVHIFQRDETGMDRIRRYLARGVVPLVALSPDLLGVEGENRDLLARMRGLSSEMLVLALLAGSEAEAPEGFDASVVRPIGLIADPEQWGVHEALADALREDLREASRRARMRAPRVPVSPVLEGLRSVSDRLRDPRRRDDVLSLVLEFAARDLSRVAVFMLRDDVAVGIAQRGMAKACGPGDEELSEIRLSRHELPALFEQALARRDGVRGRLSGSGAARLVELLGGREPGEAYVAPIESAGCIAALVYADNLPQGTPIADTTALEIVLHEAGLALDRALLERALAAAQAGSEHPEGGGATASGFRPA